MAGMRRRDGGGALLTHGRGPSSRGHRAEVEAELLQIIVRDRSGR